MPVKDEQYYRVDRGLLLCSLFPSPPRSLVDEASPKDVASWLEWLSNVARSPLRLELVEYLFTLSANSGNLIPLPRHSLDEKACMFGLEVRCPVKALQEQLRTMLLEDEDSKVCEEFCARSDGQYGIRFSHRGMLHKLEKLKLTVRRVDFSVEYDSKCDSVSSLYLRIIDEFAYYPSACFVFVHGLKQVC
jgi:hypothetical protein